jgi:hypothetical protein
MISWQAATGEYRMDSEKVAGILGAVIASAILVIAIAYGPIGQIGKPAQKAQKVEGATQPAAAPPVRGPVIRELPPQ